MNKLSIYISNEIEKKSNLIWQGIKAGGKYTLGKAWSGLKYVGSMVWKPVTLVGATAVTVEYLDEDDPTNSEGLNKEQVQQLNSQLKITLNDKFLAEYREFYKDFYKNNDVQSDIIGYSVMQAEDGTGDLSLLNGKFSVEFSEFADKFIADNMSTGKNPLGLNSKQSEIHNQKVREFVESLKKCARQGLFQECAEEKFNDENGPVDIFSRVKDQNPDSLTELTQSRTLNKEEKDEDDDSDLDSDALRLKKLREESDRYHLEQRKEMAERGLLEETEYESPDYGRDKIISNKNWYIRLEQKIEDQGSNFLGMYHKFKKLPVFSFVRAQDPKGRFSKSPSHINRRYSAILMSEGDSVSRTEIFDAPEYNIYPYYIKQRILILKFIKNELGSEFNNIYRKEMNEIESSNYADDGELSIMPNKLARSLNRIIKSAAVSQSQVINAGAFLTYFTKLLNNEYQSKEDAEKALSELKQYEAQEWGGPKFGNSGKKIGIEYTSNNAKYDNVMEIFKSIFAKDFKRVPFGSFVKFITRTNDFDEQGNDSFIDQLLQVLTGLKDLLGEKGVQEIKSLSDNPVVKPTQSRTLEVPKEIAEMTDLSEEEVVLQAIKAEGYVKDSARKTKSYTVSGDTIYSYVTISNKTYASMGKDGKSLLYFREIEQVEYRDRTNGSVKTGYKYSSSPSYYFLCGKIDIAVEGGSTTSYPVFATNVENTGVKKLEVTHSAGAEISYDKEVYFVDTSSYNLNFNRGEKQQTDAQSSSPESIESLNSAIMEDANLTMRFNISPESMLINGKVPNDINPNDKFQVGSGGNSKVYTFQQTFSWKANVQYTLGASIIDRIGTGLIDRAMRLNKKKYTDTEFLNAINDELSVALTRGLYNPGIYRALSQQDKFLMVRLLAFIGFFSINRGYLFQKAKSDSMIQTSIQKLISLNENAKKNIENMNKNR